MKLLILSLISFFIYSSSFNMKQSMLVRKIQKKIGLTKDNNIKKLYHKYNYCILESKDDIDLKKCELFHKKNIKEYLKTKNIDI